MQVYIPYMDALGLLMVLKSGDHQWRLCCGWEGRFIPLFTGFDTYQVAQDFSHQQAWGTCLFVGMFYF